MRDWVGQDHKLRAVLENDQQRAKVRRNVGKGGRAVQHPELDTALLDWVCNQNRRGLVVMDRYLQAKALRIAASLGIEGFKVFKNF